MFNQVAILFLISTTLIPWIPISTSYDLGNSELTNVYQVKAVPRRGNYHIGSRFDPTYRAAATTSSPTKISSTTSNVDLLPWEDDPEANYVTEQVQSTTTNTTPKPATTTTTTTTTVDLLPWEEGIWNFFETDGQSTIASSISTKETPITTTTTTPTTTTGFFLLPWEEDAETSDSQVTSNPITTTSYTLKPFEPVTSTTSSLISSTTSGFNLTTQNTLNWDEFFKRNPIFALVPLKPYYPPGFDPNWTKFPAKNFAIRIKNRKMFKESTPLN